MDTMSGAEAWKSNTRGRENSRRRMRENLNASRRGSVGSFPYGNGQSWKAGGKTLRPKKTINKPTHHDGVIDSEYLTWLRDDLKIFDNDGTVKKDFLDRLDPDCIEALDFNLSAGRHKPFVFDPGQHRPPAELITELQAIHVEVQQRLGKLLAMVGGRE